MFSTVFNASKRLMQSSHRPLLPSRGRKRFPIRGVLVSKINARVDTDIGHLTRPHFCPLELFQFLESCKKSSSSLLSRLDSQKSQLLPAISPFKWSIHRAIRPRKRAAIWLDRKKREDGQEIVGRLFVPLIIPSLEESFHRFAKDRAWESRIIRGERVSTRGIRGRKDTKGPRKDSIRFSLG